MLSKVLLTIMAVAIALIIFPMLMLIGFQLTFIAGVVLAAGMTVAAILLIPSLVMNTYRGLKYRLRRSNQK